MPRPAIPTIVSDVLGTLGGGFQRFIDMVRAIAPPRPAQAPALPLPRLAPALVATMAPRPPMASQPIPNPNINIYGATFYVQDWADFERQLTARGLQAKALSRSPGRS